MRRRSLAKQLIFGALVAVLVIVAAPIVYIAGRDGIAAVRAVDPSTALERGLVALVALFVPVIALAAYAHWLNVSSRPPAPHESHVPRPAEVWLLGVAVIVIVIAGWPIVWFGYRESGDAFATGEPGFGLAYGLLGIAYIAFTVFCVKRYVQWMG